MIFWWFCWFPTKSRTIKILAYLKSRRTHRQKYSSFFKPEFYCTLFKGNLLTKFGIFSWAFELCGILSVRDFKRSRFWENADFVSLVFRRHLGMILIMTFYVIKFKILNRNFCNFYKFLGICGELFYVVLFKNLITGKSMKFTLYFY